MDLQLFNQERTEDATPKRLREAREEGRVARSTDLGTGVSLAASALALKGFGFDLYSQLTGGIIGSLSNMGQRDIAVGALSTYLTPWGLVMARTLGPLMLVGIGAGVGIGLLQTGLLVNSKGLVPDLKKINPFTGFTRLFSTHTMVESLKGILKLAAIGYVAYGDVRSTYTQMPNLMAMTPAGALSVIGGTAVSILLHIGMLLIAIGALDYGYQWWDLRKSLRMTKQEVKDEAKQSDGRPEIKSRQRQIQREMSKRRKALQYVSEADVVITNPTHFAIAIRYQAGKDDAPTVLAKGVDLMAQQIKSLAADHEIPTVENRPLARALYDQVDIGKTVPAELYQAVAEVLAFVFSLKRQKRREGR